MNLIHDGAYYKDGRKVRLGDRTERSGVTYVMLAVRNGRTLVEGPWGVRSTFTQKRDVRLVRRATRREWFELVGMNEHDYPLEAFTSTYRGHPSDRLEKFELWLDEPMFNDEGEML